MIKICKGIFIFVLIFLLTGCVATKLTVKSNPIGSDVVLKKSGVRTTTDAVVTIPDEIFPKDSKKIEEDIVFKKEGFRERTLRNVVIKKGEENNIPSVTLHPLDTTLIIKSEPAGAYVSFNLPEENLPEGWMSNFNTPMEFSCTSDEARALANRLVINKLDMEGYYSMSVRPGHKVALPAGKVTTLDIPLRPIITTIKVNTEPEGAIVEDLTTGGFGYLGETPLVRNFNWEDVLIWGDRQKVNRNEGGFDTLTFTLRITKSGYEDVYLKNLKIPIGEERAFRKDLKEQISEIHFASDPDSVHVYVERVIEREVYDEAQNGFKKVQVAYKKHLGSTPFTLNMDPNDPLRHGEKLIFEKTGYKPAAILYAIGQKSYHQVLVPEVIEAR
ncbi:hypothetical protein ACFL1N_10680 [Thermodesulfobacteriota bacterium]